ncbi:hypothetical protein [Bradyrhizobium sp. ORS 86]|uniref:hypothetical protein n=1 Tax=Bradyrhizobium sp. ORS 86 TaxID=1685970 RepID=UPI0038904274
MQEIDLDLLRTERTITIGTVFPESMANAIEEHAKAELISRSSWLRRVVLAELRKANA